MQIGEAHKYVVIARNPPRAEIEVRCTDPAARQSSPSTAARAHTGCMTRTFIGFDGVPHVSDVITNRA